MLSNIIIVFSCTSILNISIFVFHWNYPSKSFFVPLSYLCRIIDVVVLAKTAAEQVCCLFIPLLVYTLLLNWFHMFIQISLRILMAIFLNITIGHMGKWLFCYPEPSKWNELLLENNAQYLYIKIVMKKVVLNQIRTCQILLSNNLNKFVIWT